MTCAFEPRTRGTKRVALKVHGILGRLSSCEIRV